MKEKVCSSCGYVGKPVPQSASSFLVDGLVWMVVGSLTIMSGLLPLLLVPLAWTLFHIMKFNSVTCPKCENLDMVSKRSRKGRRVLHTHPHQA